VDLFIAPSKYLEKKFIDFYQDISNKITYLDYGFNNKMLTSRNRNKEEQFVFGYIGTHTPQKGIHNLLQAFGIMELNCQLKIWGRRNHEVTSALEDFIQILPDNKKANITWEGEYANDDILESVFNKVDAIVVPSIWEENSPLVIHEAQ
jgi:glycosyltransferase involved in cell wall biosynthesis